MVTYIIQMSFIDIETLKVEGFKNLWATPTEDRARKECIFLQTAANKRWEGEKMKTIYKYEAIFIYDD